VELAEEDFELDYQHLYKVMVKDEDPQVRAEAIEGLYESEDPGLIEILAGLLERDPSEEVQAAAAMNLGRFAIQGELKQIRQSHTDRIRQVLFDTLRNNLRPVEVRRRCLESIAPLEGDEVIKLIKEAYASGDSSFKLSSIYAMGKNCRSIWLPILVRELSNPEAEFRYEAAVACGELEEEEAVPHLIERVNDADTEVQLAAIQALGKIGGKEAKTCLTKLRRSPVKAVRQMAEQALEELEIYEEPLSFRD
jgi:HEAT repeat protein